MPTKQAICVLTNKQTNKQGNELTNETNICDYEAKKNRLIYSRTSEPTEQGNKTANGASMQMSSSKRNYGSQCSPRDFQDCVKMKIHLA